MTDFDLEESAEPGQTSTANDRNESSRSECNPNLSQPQPAHGAPKFGTMVPNRIFVGGLPSSTGEDELASLFSRWGRVRQAKIIADRACISKGYGFVTYETEEEAMRALTEAAELVYCDRKLNVAPAIKKQPVGYDNMVQSPSPTTTPTMYYPAAGIPLYQNGLQLYNPQTPGSPVTPSLPQASSAPQQNSTVQQPQTQQAAVTPVQSEMNPNVPTFYPHQASSVPTTPQGCYPAQLLCSPTVFFPPNQPIHYIPANAGAPAWSQPNQWRWISPGYSPGYPPQPQYNCIYPGSPGVGYILIPVPAQQPQAPLSDTQTLGRQGESFMPCDTQTVPPNVSQNAAQTGQCMQNDLSFKDEEQGQNGKRDRSKQESEPQPTGLLTIQPVAPGNFTQPLTVNTQFGNLSGLLQIQDQAQQTQISANQLEQRQKLQPLVFTDSANRCTQVGQPGCFFLYGAHGQVYCLENGQLTPRQGWGDKGQSSSLPSTPLRQHSDSGADCLSTPSEMKSQGSVYTNSPRDQYQSQNREFQYLPFRPELALSPGFDHYERRRHGYYRPRRPYRGFHRNYGRDYCNGGYYQGHQRPRYHPMPVQFQQQIGVEMMTPPYTPGIPPPNLVTEEITKQVADLDIKV